MEIDAILKLIETDENTRAEIESLHQKRYQLKQAVEAEKKQFSSDAWNDVNQKVAERKKELDDTIQKDARASEEYYAKASAQLKEKFEKNRAAWTAAIEKQILHGD